MNWKVTAIWGGVIGIIVFFIDANDKTTRTEEAQRQAIVAQAVARVSKADPLQNLAGCMANHASEVSKIILAAAVYKISAGISMPPEEIEEFNEVRNVLYSKCADTYYQIIVEKQGNLTYQNLNHAFIEVLKEDPGVKSFVQIHVEAQKSRSAIYVK